MGVIDVSIVGAVKAPFFFKGMHTNADWLTARNNPAPWAELGSDKVNKACLLHRVGHTVC